MFFYPGFSQRQLTKFSPHAMLTFSEMFKIWFYGIYYRPYYIMISLS
jgi:hypothetical protein